MSRSKSVGIGVCCLLIGVIVGSISSWKYTNRLELQLQQRQTCSRLADNYAKTSTDDQTLVSIDQVDYSKARNSCIAALSVYTSYPNGDTDEGWRVTDLLTREDLLNISCNMRSGDCGNGRNVQAYSDQQKTFKQAIGLESNK